MTVKPSCETCGLKGEKQVLGLLEQEPAEGALRIAIVHGAPGREEVQADDPFVGSGWILLNEVLKGNGLNVAEILTTNACICSTPVTRDPSEAELICCRPRLFTELDNFKPDRILAVGMSAAYALLGKDIPGISDLHGRPIRLSTKNSPTNVDFDAWVIVTQEPSTIMRAPGMFPEFANDVAKLIWSMPPKIITPHVRPCTNIHDLKWMLRGLSRCEDLALDTETTGLNPLEDYILSVSISPDDKVCYIFPERLVRDDQAYEMLKEFIESREFITHNGVGFDDQFLLKCWEIRLRTKFDTMLGHYLTDERKGTHGLDDLACEYFGMNNYKRKVKSYASGAKGSYANVPEDELFMYQAIDTCLTKAVAPIITTKLHDEGQYDLLINHLQPVARDLSEIEMNGVLIDAPYLKGLGQKWVKQADRLQRAIRHEIADPDFNVRSAPQVAGLIYDDLGFKPIRGKGRTTDAKVLQELIETYDSKLLKLIVDARQKLHLESTYVRGLIKRLDTDGRLRTDFLPHGTETGRLSSQNPNLHNIPQLIGPAIRNAFTTDEDHLLIEGDYSQLEFRVAAYYSKDPLLRDAFLQGKDFHTSVAAYVFHKSLEEVTHHERHIAKTINFGIIYGRAAKSLAKTMHCSVYEAQAYLDQYLDTYQGLKDFMHWCQKQVTGDQVISTPMGRKRRFAFIPPNKWMRLEMERQAMNMPIQSLASDICLDAIHRIHNSGYPGVKIISTVHDSILVEAERARAKEAAWWLKSMMEDTHLIDTDIPFVADVKIGERWGSLTKLKAA